MSARETEREGALFRISLLGLLALRRGALEGEKETFKLTRNPVPNQVGSATGIALSARASPGTRTRENISNPVYVYRKNAIKFSCFFYMLFGHKHNMENVSVNLRLFCSVRAVREVPTGRKSTMKQKSPQPGPSRRGHALRKD